MAFSNFLYDPIFEAIEKIHPKEEVQDANDIFESIQKEETFQNEEPKFYDEYDEQYVIKYFNLISFLEKYYLLELQNSLCRRKNLGKSYLSKM